MTTSEDQAAIVSAALVARLRRRARRRAWFDAVVIAVLAATAVFAPDTQTALRLAVSILSVGILVILIRRDGDVIALARADRWRADAIEGRGISLDDWCNGKELGSWADRRQQL